MRNITTQLKKGGEKFHVNPREHKLLVLLISKSPHTVPFEQIKKACECSQAHARKMVADLRDIVVMEGGTIECVPRNGYRIIKVGPFGE